MADNVKVKVQDPRASEFRKDQLVINTKQGSLFYKSQQGLHELVTTGIIQDLNVGGFTSRPPTTQVISVLPNSVVFPTHYSESLELASASIDSQGFALFQSASIGGWTIDVNSIQKPGVFEINSVTPSDGTDFILSASFFNVNDLGKVDATAGRIGGWELGFNFLSASNGTFVISSDTSGDYYLSASNFQVSTTGELTASGGQIGGFIIDDHSITTTGVEINNSSQALFISSSNFKVDHEGNITASNVDLSGNISATTGNIGGFEITENALTGSNFFLSGAASTGTEFFISTSGFNIKGDGTFTASSGQIGGFEIDDHSITTTGVEINNATQTLFISSSNFKVEHNGAITGSQVLFTGGDIGGFTIDSTSLVGGNLQLFSVGQIKSADYISSPEPLVGKGFNLSVGVDGLGFLEVGNARIRGTLSTMVFEKETVNAVGGALYVANSTVISASAWSGSFVAATDTTMSVQNVSGFTGSEFCTIKKVSNTGFSTEYIKIISTSRYNPTSDLDFTGKLFVERGVGVDATTVNSSSLGGLAAQSQSYTGSQVIVSTGRENTGYVFINANPTDPTTPYIDIAERTGSSLYDIALKVRLGDLSGLANTAPVNTATPGFGLMSENVFLSGHITASSGLIGGFNILETALQAGDVFQLSSSLNTNDPVSFISSSDFKVSAGGVMTASAALIGGFTVDNDHIHDTAGNLQLTGSTGTLKAVLGEIGGFILGPSSISSSANTMILSSTDESIQVGDITAQGIKISGSAARMVFTNAGNEVLVLDDTVDNTNPGIKITDGVLIISSSTDLGADKGALQILSADQGPGNNDAVDRTAAFIGISDTDDLERNYSSLQKTTQADASGSGQSFSVGQTVGKFVALVARAETHADDDNPDDDNSATGDVKVAHAIVASATSSNGRVAYSFLGEDGVLLNRDTIMSQDTIVGPRFVSKFNRTLTSAVFPSTAAQFTGSFRGIISSASIDNVSTITLTAEPGSGTANVDQVIIGADNNQQGNFRVATNEGHATMGPENSTFNHFRTDRDNFYFQGASNTNFYFDGTSSPVKIRSYNDELVIQASSSNANNNQIVLTKDKNKAVGFDASPSTDKYKIVVGGHAVVGANGGRSDKIVMLPTDFLNGNRQLFSSAYTPLYDLNGYVQAGTLSQNIPGNTLVGNFHIPVGYKATEIDFFIYYNDTSNPTQSRLQNYYQIKVNGVEFDSDGGVTSTATQLVGETDAFVATVQNQKQTLYKNSIFFSPSYEQDNQQLRFIVVQFLKVDKRFRFYGGYIHITRTGVST